VQCLEQAEVVREGTDISIFTYSRMRYVVMQAVAELEKRGYNPEVGGPHKSQPAVHHRMHRV
jgi:pyruvate dehydrogenase E1 component beta subunit